MMSQGHIARSTGILAVSTGLSRVLGFIRDILLAGLFGTGVQAQAFVIAFRLPNLMRDFVGEGAMSSGVVPVLSAYRAKGEPEEFWRLSQSLLTRMFVILCAIGLIGTLAAPQIVRVIAPGFVEDPDKFQLTVQLTRVLFPFIILVGLWAYFMGLLNSLRHFAMPALGPAVLNLAMIIACLWCVPLTTPGILAVAIAVMIGGVIQLAIQLPVAARLGFRWRWRWRHPGVGEVLRLIGPRMVGSGAYQVNVLVHTALASLSGIVGTGAVVALYFANRLVQLPLALFGTASAQASLPSLSEQAAQHDLAGMRDTLLSMIRMIGFIMLPSMIGLMVLAFPIVGGLFERGAFDHGATLMTAQAVIYYAFGLLAYAVSRVLTGAFYALRDTRTPVKLAIEAVVVNVLFSLALMWPMQVGGLALASAIANILNAARLTRALERRLGAALLAPALGPLSRQAGAALLMGPGCWAVSRLVGESPPWVGLPLMVLAGIACYIGSCVLFRVPELSTALRWLRRVPSTSE